MAVAALAGSVALLLCAVPAQTLLAFGERAALLSAGLRQPEEGAQMLNGWLPQNGTEGTDSATGTTPRLGEAQTHSPAPSSAPSATNASSSGKSGDGKVLTQQMSVGDSFVQSVAIRNKSGKTVDVAASLAHVPNLSFRKNSTAPQVLIMHTHTTECYMSEDTGSYRKDDPTRTADPARNMVAVGERVVAQLKAAGIGVLHDTEIHDQPYTGAYSHSKAAIQKYLKKYPSIRVVLDIHRDAVYGANGAYVKPTAVINGKKAAQVMIIVGMMNTKSVPNKHTAENLSFGVRLQQNLHKAYPGLARPLLLANARYNQQLTNGSLLIEVGGHANTLEEACYSGELLGKSLAEVLGTLAK